METLSNAVVLAYHGCRKDVARKVLSGREVLKPSENEYDWLGTGIYFWEADPHRGLEWAIENYGKKNADVIGAAIHLGRCLNLMSRHAFDIVRRSYEDLSAKFEKVPGAPSLPRNVKGKRKLDCMVINHLHRLRASRVPQPFRPYDTVRGLFTEGEEAFPGSGFFHKTHVQICVREARVIKGCFRVPDAHLVEGLGAAPWE